MLSSAQLGQLEWIAAGFGAVNIVLLILRSVWNYAFGMVMVLLYLLIFWERRLYAESVLQLFFFAAQGYGWWLWARLGSGASGDRRVPVRWLAARSRIVWLAGMSVLSFAVGGALAQFTDAAAPFVDAPIAVFSMGAQVLLAYRRIENWLLWIAIDLASVGLYLSRGLEPTAALYCGFLVMSVVGLREWRASLGADLARPAA